jgi:hypothetical protein
LDRGLGGNQSGYARCADEQDLCLSGIEYRFLGSPVCSAVLVPSKDYKSDKHLQKFVSPTCIARLSEKLPIQIGYANTAAGISDGCL